MATELKGYKLYIIRCIIINKTKVVQKISQNFLALNIFLTVKIYFTFALNGHQNRLWKGGIMNGKAVTSCIIPAMRAEGVHIQTIEGVRMEIPESSSTGFCGERSVQCGFCTPGMSMSAKALLDVNPNPTREDIQEALGGKIYRCTGYVNIEEAVESAANIMKGASK